MMFYELRGKIRNSTSIQRLCSVTIMKSDFLKLRRVNDY